VRHLDGSSTVGVRGAGEIAANDPPPAVEELAFKSLYRKEIYDARTADGWVLQITRYRPVPQLFQQPILGEPILLVPGWSQNRHAFTCASFVKRLLYYGADCHVLELRGHGRSSVELQRRTAAAERRPPPPDLDFGWDLDSYLLEDLPAAVRAVKERTGRAKIVYLGNSMGGMLGYGYAGSHDDLMGLVTIGAPSDIGRGFLLMRAAALFGPAILGPLIDALCSAATGVESARHGTARLLRKLRVVRRAADLLAGEGELPRGVRFSHVPVDSFLRLLARLSTEKNLKRFERIARHVGSLLNPSRVTADEFRWLLSQGGEKEPRRVVEQFARWIRNDEMKCYRSGFDYKAHFPDIGQEHLQHPAPGQEPLLRLATGEGQLAPRADHGLRPFADLPGRARSGGVRRGARTGSLVRLRIGSAAKATGAGSRMLPF